MTPIATDSTPTPSQPENRFLRGLRAFWQTMNGEDLAAVIDLHPTEQFPLALYHGELRAVRQLLAKRSVREMLRNHRTSAWFLLAAQSGSFDVLVELVKVGLPLDSSTDPRALPKHVQEKFGKHFAHKATPKHLLLALTDLIPNILPREKALPVFRFLAKQDLDFDTCDAIGNPIDHLTASTLDGQLSLYDFQCLVECLYDCGTSITRDSPNSAPCAIVMAAFSPSPHRIAVLSELLDYEPCLTFMTSPTENFLDMMLSAYEQDKQRFGKLFRLFYHLDAISATEVNDKKATAVIQQMEAADAVEIYASDAAREHLEAIKQALVEVEAERSKPAQETEVPEDMVTTKFLSFFYVDQHLLHPASMRGSKSPFRLIAETLDATDSVFDTWPFLRRLRT